MQDFEAFTDWLFWWRERVGFRFREPPCQLSGTVGGMSNLEQVGYDCVSSPLDTHLSIVSSHLGHRNYLGKYRAKSAVFKLIVTSRRVIKVLARRQPRLGKE